VFRDPGGDEELIDARPALPERPAGPCVEGLEAEGLPPATVADLLMSR
jgi:hypothetical protein